MLGPLIKKLNMARVMPVDEKMPYPSECNRKKATGTKAIPPIH